MHFYFQVVEQYLPESHTFLACIFLEISWSSWMRSISENTPIPVKTKIQHCILHLVIKMCNEPNIRNNHTDKAKLLIKEAESFNWCFVEVSTYQQVMDWYVMSCDPSVIFKTDSTHLDCMLLRYILHVFHNFIIPIVLFEMQIITKCWLL